MDFFGDIDLEIEDVVVQNEEGRQCIFIDWSATIGYGNLTLIVDRYTGEMKLHTESMDEGDDKDFTRAIFNKLIDRCTIEG